MAGGAVESGCPAELSETKSFDSKIEISVFEAKAMLIPVFMTARKRTPPRLTKRERKALSGNPGGGGGGHDHAHHIHCVACGVHLDPSQFSATPSTARWVTCQHGSRFAACEGCVTEAKRLLDEHDRTGRPVDAAPAFH